MGFCSGTDIFDPVVKAVLESEIANVDKEAIIKALTLALWDHDWDCESDSAYIDNEIVQRVQCKGAMYGARLYQGYCNEEIEAEDAAYYAQQCIDDEKRGFQQ